jgi:hypothetical protein
MLPVDRLDDVQQRHPAAGMQRAQRGVAQRHVQFRRLVDDDEKDALMSRGRGQIQVFRKSWLASHPAIAAATTATMP